MKRIALTLLAFCLAQMAIAQNEVAIEQTIDQSIGYLNIYADWDVRLMHRETNGYRIAIVVPERYAEIAAETQICNINGDTLTITENTMLPKGTVVELEGNLSFRKINICDMATASADHINVPETTISYYIYLGQNADFQVNHIQFCGKPILSVNEKSTLRIDTITGQGEPSIELYVGKFEYGLDRLEGKITVKEYEKPNWNYSGKLQKTIKTKMVGDELVTTERYQTWCRHLMFGASVGFKQGADAADYNSPYTYTNTLSVNLGLTTLFRFGEHWSLSTGLMCNINDQYMFHQLKFEDGKLEVIDGQVPIQQNMLESWYLGVPVELFRYLGKQGRESISLDYYCGYLLEGLLCTHDAINHNGWIGESARPIFTPWKMEFGLSFNTQRLGIIHGVRVFINLLPEFNKAATTDKFNSFGVEIKL